MGVLSKGTDFSNGDQVTDTNLDNLVDNATFTSSAVDDSTTAISGAGAIIIKDGAVGAANVTATGSTSSRSVSDRFAEVINVKDFGAVGDGVTDDTSAIQAALDSGSKYVVGNASDTYLISSVLQITSSIDFDGRRAKLKTALSTYSDAILVKDGSVDTVIRNWTVDATGDGNCRFGIQVYGVGATTKPEHVRIDNNRTINTVAGGVYVNTANWITITGNYNDGGYRGIGIEAPNPLNGGSLFDTQHVLIKNNTCINTTKFGIQTYYGAYIDIIGNHVIGDLMNDGDRTCITVDRSLGVTVMGNVTEKAPVDQIFATGVKDCSITGNITSGGLGGIQVYYNNEDIEDASIEECVNVTVSNNSCNLHTNRPIIFNGVLSGSIVGNTVRGNTSTGNSIIIQDGVRSNDSVDMDTNNIVITGNTCPDSYSQSLNNSGSDANTIRITGNIFSSYSGLSADQSILEQDAGWRFGHLNLERVGIVKSSDQSNSRWLREFTLDSSETYHKGFVSRYHFGKMQYQDTDGNLAFGIEVGEGAGRKDVELYKEGAGIIMKSPDGTRRRLTIDNSGNLSVSSAL